MTNDPMFYQQGDVIIEYLEDYETLPINATIKEDGIIAEGEATGHKHIITGEDVTLYVNYGMMYIDAPNGGTVIHNKRAPIDIDPGRYKVRMVQEFDHINNMTRTVTD